MTDTIPTAPTLTATFRYVASLDNYEPVARDEARGTLEAWYWPDYDETRYRLRDGVSQFKDVTHALFLIDDGITVQPLYVAGWSGAMDYVSLHAFPVNVKADGSPRMRADRPEQVDYSTWMLGPRRAYHLKISRD